MANTFDTVLEQRWASEAHIVYEQRVSKFRGSMREVTAPAKTFNFQTFTNSPYITGRSRNNPLVISAQYVDDVACTSQLGYKFYAIDINDQALVNFDYRNTITEMVVDQIWQFYDDTVITALMATTNSLLTLPTAYTTNYAGTTAIAKTFNSNNVPMEDRHMVLGPTGFEQLVQDSSFVNNFHFRNMAVATGKISGGDAAGIEIRMSTRLQAGASASYVRSFAWHKRAVGVLLSEDLAIDISWIPEIQAWGFCARIQAGAVIIDNTGLVAFDVTV